MTGGVNMYLYGCVSLLVPKCAVCVVCAVCAVCVRVRTRVCMCV